MSDENKREREWLKWAYWEPLTVDPKSLNRSCPKCSYENSESAIFCVKCGERLDNNADVIIKKNYKVGYWEEKIVKMTKKEFEALMDRPQISKDYYDSLLVRPNVTKEEYEKIKKRANMTIWQRIKDQCSDDIFGWVVFFSILLIGFGVGILAVEAIFYFGKLLGLAKGWSFAVCIILVCGWLCLGLKYFIKE